MWSLTGRNPERGPMAKAVVRVEGTITSDAELRESFERVRPDFPKGTPFWTDRSFQEAARRHPCLKTAAAYWPRDVQTPIFSDQTQIERRWSSYKDHGYGYLFYALTRVLKPVTCVELGVLQGFSLLTVAAALRDNGGGRIHGFDLFEAYPYRHEPYAQVAEQLNASGLSRWATVEPSDAFEVPARFDDVDYLHVDISNHGDTYRTVFAQWACKVRQIILLEGGSVARDRIAWMMQYRKPPIVQALEEIRVRYPDWEIAVFDPYPSLTVAIRRKDRRDALLA